MPIGLKLDGFEDVLKDIEKAGTSIDKISRSTAAQSAEIIQSELKSEMQKAGVPTDLIERMPQPQIEQDGYKIDAKVGYKKGAYNPRNISDGYKVVFLNYGTPDRKKHGQMKPKGFIIKAKKNSQRKVKKQFEKALKEMLSRLEK